MRVFAPKVMTADERKTAANLIEKGRLAKEFTESIFWAKYLGPWLRDEYDACGQKSLFDPAQHKATVEAIAIQLAFNSGMAQQIERLKEELAIWITKGKDAQAELTRDNELLVELGDKR